MTTELLIHSPIFMLGICMTVTGGIFCVLPRTKMGLGVVLLIVGIIISLGFLFLNTPTTDVEVTPDIGLVLKGSSSWEECMESAYTERAARMVWYIAVCDRMFP